MYTCTCIYVCVHVVCVYMKLHMYHGMHVMYTVPVHTGVRIFLIYTHIHVHVYVYVMYVYYIHDMKHALHNSTCKQ